MPWFVINSGDLKTKALEEGIRNSAKEQCPTPTYKLMLKFQTLDSFLKEQLRISKRNYRQSQANITVAGIIQSEGKE